jgi:AcrR family transcriptional regulator
MSTVSPRYADPRVGDALVEVAARILAEEGPAGLSLRRLAREVGTSTMSVYTHFGSMEELRRAVRAEGFARFAAHLHRVRATDDPVADLIRLGEAYRRNARANPNLYRAMFMDHSDQMEPTSKAAGSETFTILVDAVRRCIELGRFRPTDPERLAIQLWAYCHGLVALELTGMLERAQVESAAASTGLALLLAVTS